MEMHLTCDRLDFWVDARVSRFGDKWLAVAELAEQADIGLGMRPLAALKAALSRLDSDDVGALTFALFTSSSHPVSSFGGRETSPLLNRAQGPASTCRIVEVN